MLKCMYCGCVDRGVAPPGMHPLATQCIYALRTRLEVLEAAQ